MESSNQTIDFVIKKLLDRLLLVLTDDYKCSRRLKISVWIFCKSKISQTVVTTIVKSIYLCVALPNFFYAFPKISW